MSKADPTAGTRMARLRANNKAKGLAEVKVWIPENRRQELLRLTADWRIDHFEEYEKKLDK